MSKINHEGGLALLWKIDVDIKVVTSLPNHINALVNKDKEDGWRFTGFYGAPKTFNHHLSWSLLGSLQHRYTLLWLCAGHFNEILRSHEKLSGRLRPMKQMQDFKDAMDGCSFADLGYVGNKFTWNNVHKGGVTIWERLDRAVATNNWISIFPAVKVVHLEYGTSNHKALFIHPSGIPLLWAFLHDRTNHGTLNKFC